MKFTALLLCVTLVAAAGFYTDDPNVFELSYKNFNEVVYNTNYTTIVEFYAPWCGYCKKMEPVWRRLGKFLSRDSQYGVQVASVNCDEAKNKPLCSSFKVKSFPTLMTFRPPKYKRGVKKTGRHVPEPYTGQRELAPLVQFVTGRIKNYVKRFHRISAPAFPDWLNEDLHKIVVLTKLNSISPLLKTLAIDLLDTSSVAVVQMDSPKLGLTVKVNDVDVDVPVEEGDQLPVLLVYNKESKSFTRYPKLKLKNLHKIEKWIATQLGVTPLEGSLSTRAKRLSKFRGSSAAHDEL